MSARHRPTDPLLLRSGASDADGNVGGTTIIDSNLVGANDYLTGATIIITSGNCIYETRDISGFAAATGTITVSAAFSAQIVSGVAYRIMGVMPAIAEVAALQADVGDASASALGSLYGIVGNPSASLSTTILDGIDARTNNATLNGMLDVPDNVDDTLLRFILDTIFLDDFDDESLSTTLWGTAVVTGSTTVTESASAPNTLRIYNSGAGTTGTGTLPSILRFSRNLSIRSKIELYVGAAATDGERCYAGLILYEDANNYIYYGAFRDTSDVRNIRGGIVYNIAGAGATTVTVDAAITDNIAREYRIDVTEENVLFYIDDILVYTLQDASLNDYYIQLYGESQNNTDVIDIRFDYCKVNRLSDDYRQIYKKLLEVQGGSDSIGTLVNSIDSALDLNYIRGSTTADGTEQTIYENTGTRAFMFTNVDIDISNMAAGDSITIKKYKRIDGTNYRLISSTIYAGAPTLTGITVFGDEGCQSGIKVTLQQTAGTNRAYPWIYFDEVA